MPGLKAALVAHARVERVSVSAVVRRAIGRELGSVDVSLGREAVDRPAVVDAHAPAAFVYLCCTWRIQLVDATH
jgi:hypothetical protein